MEDMAIARIRNPKLHRRQSSFLERGKNCESKCFQEYCIKYEKGSIILMSLRTVFIKKNGNGDR